MKYISNAFSPDMVADNGVFRMEYIDYPTFISETKDAMSIVGNKKFASYLDVTFRPQYHVYLSEGDVLYIASDSTERVRRTDFIPKDVKFYRITVITNEYYEEDTEINIDEDVIVVEGDTDG